MKILKNRKVMKKDITKMALYQSLGIVVYIALVSLIFWNGDKWFGTHRYLGPIFVLLLFSVSAMVCGLLMFYQPFLMYLKKKNQDAINLVFYSVGFLVLFLMFFLIALAIL